MGPGSTTEQDLKDVGKKNNYIPVCPFYGWDDKRPVSVSNHVNNSLRICVFCPNFAQLFFCRRRSNCRPFLPSGMYTNSVSPVKQAVPAKSHRERLKTWRNLTRISIQADSHLSLVQISWRGVLLIPISVVTAGRSPWEQKLLWEMLSMLAKTSADETPYQEPHITDLSKKKGVTLFASHSTITAAGLKWHSERIF